MNTSIKTNTEHQADHISIFAKSLIAVHQDRNDPAQISLLLSASFIPAMNKAADLLRQRLPRASDGELLEQIFFAGIVATIESVERQLRVDNHLRAQRTNS